MRVTTIAVCVLAAACGGREASSAEKVRDHCRVIGERLVAVARQQPPAPDQATRDRIDKILEETSRMVADRCVDDGWSPEVLRCAMNAKDVQLECTQKLTATQAKNLGDGIQEVWTKGLAEL